MVQAGMLTDPAFWAMSGWCLLLL